MDAREVIARALEQSVTTEISGFKVSGYGTTRVGEVVVRKDPDRFLAALEASGMAIVPLEATGQNCPARHSMHGCPLAMIAAAKDQTDGR